MLYYAAVFLYLYFRQNNLHNKDSAVSNDFLVLREVSAEK